MMVQLRKLALFAVFIMFYNANPLTKQLAKAKHLVLPLLVQVHTITVQCIQIVADILFCSSVLINPFPPTSCNEAMRCAAQHWAFPKACIERLSHWLASCTFFTALLRKGSVRRLMHFGLLAARIVCFTSRSSLIRGAS
eukprot:m.301748 g.301748  ORF g.301748 m.301748 type:complete len:139 (+) comp15880_c0_seq2:2617-3033(+)